MSVSADISDPLSVIGISAKFHIGASLLCILCFENQARWKCGAEIPMHSPTLVSTEWLAALCGTVMELCMIIVVHGLRNVSACVQCLQCNVSEENTAIND